MKTKRYFKSLLIPFIMSVLVTVSCSKEELETIESPENQIELKSGSYVTALEIVLLAYDRGIPCDMLAKMTAIALAESPYYDLPYSDPYARGANSDGTYDYGIWQINSRNFIQQANQPANMAEMTSSCYNVGWYCGPWYKGDLYNPYVNSWYMKYVYKMLVVDYGIPLGQVWHTYGTSKYYEKYPIAVQAVKDAINIYGIGCNYPQQDKNSKQRIPNIKLIALNSKF